MLLRDKIGQTSFILKLYSGSLDVHVQLLEVLYDKMKNTGSDELRLSVSSLILYYHFLHFTGMSSQTNAFVTPSLSF